MFSGQLPQTPEAEINPDRNRRDGEHKHGDFTLLRWTTAHARHYTTCMTP